MTKFRERLPHKSFSSQAEAQHHVDRMSLTRAIGGFIPIINAIANIDPVVQFAAAIGTFSASEYFDILDGVIARENKINGFWGDIKDVTADWALNAGIYGALIYNTLAKEAPDKARLTLAIVFGSAIVLGYLGSIVIISRKKRKAA